MSRHIAPENDYRGVTTSAIGPEVRVAVVIPVYNRVELLANTLAGLVAQSRPPHQVIVADDGSEEDVSAVTHAFADDLPLQLVRQDHDGYGAGRARNLGAGVADGDVLIFIDADCIPDPDLVAHHAARQRRADNLVVIGSRHHMDTTDITTDALRRGASGLRDRVTTSAPVGGDLVPDDFRRVFYRRTAGLRLGDEAFRSLVSSNFSIRRDQFARVGGFSEDFDRWGGEDTELGWRLFNDGCFFVPDNDAAIYHQTQQDAGDSADWRQISRTANDGIIQAKIPHRFYRKSRRGYIYEVPKVTWVIAPTVAHRAVEVWEQLLKQSFTDFEVIFTGGDAELEQLGEALAGDPRITVLPPTGNAASAFTAAIAASRGEYLAVLHGWASLDHRLASRAVRRLDANPRTSIVRSGYQIVTGDGTVTYLYDEAIADIDTSWGGLPVFAMTRRREWAKLANTGLGPAELWRAVQRLSDTKALRDGMVAIPALSPADELPTQFPEITGERTHLMDDLTKGGPRRAVRAVAKYALAKAQRKPYRPVGLDTKPRGGLDPEPVDGAKPGVSYIGWLGRENFGDEIMLRAVQQLLPDAVVGYEAPQARLLLLGGGTLINRLTYLEALRRHDSPRVERAVFGTGVADPGYWGITEPVDQWLDFLDSCIYVGVRGPRSEATLREWGFTGETEILGDPALSIEPVRPVERRDGLVVVSPAYTRDQLFGDSDEAVFAAFAAMVEALRAKGHPVAYLSCHPSDDRFIMEIMHRSGSADAEYVAAYAAQDEGIALLAAADVVVAERLHAAVIAAAAGTPFVAIEYRPKVRDFAMSVDSDRFAIRSDEVSGERLSELVGSIGSDGTVRERLAAAVGVYRSRQLRAATSLARVLDGE